MLYFVTTSFIQRSFAHPDILVSKKLAKIAQLLYHLNEHLHTWQYNFSYVITENFPVYYKV